MTPSTIKQRAREPVELEPGEECERSEERPDPQRAPFELAGDEPLADHRSRRTPPRRTIAVVCEFAAAKAITGMPPMNTPAIGINDHSATHTASAAGPGTSAARAIANASTPSTTHRSNCTRA